MVKLAEKLKARLPQHVQLDDLISSGTFGLMDVIASFDPNRGVKFTSYCSRRIIGSMLDGIREMDWVPRMTRRRANQLREARTALSNELQREPTSEELAERLRVSVEKLKELIDATAAVSITSLSRRRVRNGDITQEFREIDIVADGRAREGLDGLEDTDGFQRMLRGLPRHLRLMMTLMYVDGMNQAETGAALGVSMSRVSQMHSNVLAVLKSRMTEQSNEPANTQTAGDHERTGATAAVHHAADDP